MQDMGAVALISCKYPQIDWQKANYFGTQTPKENESHQKKISKRAIFYDILLDGR